MQFYYGGVGVGRYSFETAHDGDARLSVLSVLELRLQNGCAETRRTLGGQEEVKAEVTRRRIGCLNVVVEV